LNIPVTHLPIQLRADFARVVIRPFTPRQMNHLYSRTLILPYGIADSFTTMATVSVDALLAAME
jgi:hypothetical protein